MNGSKYIVDKNGERRAGCFGNAIRYGIGLPLIGFLLWVLFSMCGCKSVQTQTEYKERTVEVRVRDTVITTQADSASIRALLHCDSAYNVVIDELTTLQGSRIKADVTTKGTTNSTTNSTTKGLQIEFDCKEDSMRIVCHMKDSIISDLTQQVKVLSVPRERSGYDRFCSTFFWVVVIILLILIAFWVCDKIPATKPYTTAIKGILKIGKFF